MKSHRFFRYLPLFAIAGAAADTFELKDGTKLEGTILKEDGSDYILQVQVTKTIKDERRVPKADVVNHIAEKKDETAFAEFAKLLPVPDLQDAAAYQAEMKKLEAFLKEYPDSPKKAEVLKILSVLEKEHDVIAAGGVKFNGRMISASERVPQAYALDARILAFAVKKAAEEGDRLNALRLWMVLEAGHSGSTAYRETIPFILQVMKAQHAAVSSSLAGFDARTKARTDGLAGMSGSDQARSKQAIEEEQASYLARVEREKAAGMKWLSLDPYVKAPMEETVRLLDNEMRRLQNLDTQYLPKTEAAYEAAYEAITKEGATQQEIDTAISNARSAGLSQEYVDQLLKLAPAKPAP
jgi:hypothetical protein